MIIARDFRKEDIAPINDIFERNPSISVPSLKYMIINVVTEREEDKKIVAYGALKIFAEAVLIMDKEMPKRDRAQALIEAMQTAILYARDAGVEVLYANSNDDNFTRCLENRYKFVRVPGTLLCLDLTSSLEDE